MAIIKEINGLIFNSECQTIVNTVNCDGVMGKGLALEFKLRFPEEMYNIYLKSCREKELKPGKLLLFKKSIPWVLNFPTKDHWKLPSKIEYIEAGLKKFSEFYRYKEIESIAFPKLGTKSGGLKWEIVEKVMYKNLRPLPELKVEIYQFDLHNLNIRDDLFKSFKEKIVNFKLEEYAGFIGLGKKQANILIKKIENNDVNKMFDICNIEGIGRESIEKIYNFAKEDLVIESSNFNKFEKMVLF